MGPLRLHAQRDAQHQDERYGKHDSPTAVQPKGTPRTLD
jgi:hypothetical protein